MDIQDILKQKKYKPDLRPQDQLFPIDWDWVRKNNRCGICGNKLYESKKFPDSIICRSKKHKFFKIKKWK